MEELGTEQDVIVQIAQEAATQKKITEEIWFCGDVDEEGSYFPDDDSY